MALAFAVSLTALPQNLVNINVVHYYLGAKYPVPYSGFYEAVYAALERPQVGMHDLDHPPGYLRAQSAEQRAYYIDLLRAEGVAFDPLSDLAALGQQATDVGAVGREADSILHHHLPAALIGEFREDVRRAFILEGAESNIAAENRSIGDDYGYNGSPFYALVRHFDPSLYRPFDRWTGIINLVWQIPALGLAIWLMGTAIGLGVTQRLAAVALAFASWDLVGWALPGLIFAGLWLPLGVACWAVSRGLMKTGGAAIAWSGLLKIFPYLLVLPSVLYLVRGTVHGAGGHPGSTSRRSHVQLLLGCAVASAALFLLTLAADRSWSEFVGKILVQFQSKAYLQNSISLNQLLMVVGLYDSPALLLLRVLLASVLIIFLWRLPDGPESRALPRRFLLLLALTGCFVDTWFNYYALAAMILLPWAAESHPRGAALCALALAGAYLLPEFDSPLLAEHHALWFLKLLPYVAIPCWLAYLEFRSASLSRNARVIVTTMLVLCAALATAEAARGRWVRSNEASGNRALDQEEPARALAYFERQLRWSPRNAVAEMNKGICQAMLQNDSAALAAFSGAMILSPSSVDIRINYAHMLFKLGRFGEASQQVDAALQLSPCSVEAWVERGRIHRAKAEFESARVSALRALELQPTSAAARDILQSLEEP